MSDFTDRPVLHPNFPLLCFAIEALDYKKEATARQKYKCRFCFGVINAGDRYARLGKKTAHVDCVREFRELLRMEAPHA